MRITNGIMLNNSLNNIALNKKQVDKLNNQLTSEKKILRPSEDPIIAMRALRLRSTHAEILQYLNKNIPDAQQWLKTSEDALSVTNKLLEEFIAYCNQGVADYNDVNQRQTLYTQLKQYRDEMYSTANAREADRSVFTGYKTDKTLSFESDDEPENKKYEITQKFSGSEIDTVSRLTGCINPEDIKEVYESDVRNSVLHRMQLAYKDIDAENITITGVTFPPEINVQTKKIADIGDKVYAPTANDIFVVPETGELIMGENAYNFLRKKEDIAVNYTKTGFDAGDLRPEHYFDCRDISSIYPDEHVTYTAEDQYMNYNINFNQTLRVNTLGKDVYTVGMSRSIDDMMESVYAAIEAEKTVENIKSKISATTDTVTLSKLNSMLDAAKLQMTYAEENMSSSFAKGITHYQKYQETINLAIADIGTKSVRLTLNKDRLGLQELNVKELKSMNEEVNVAETAVIFNAAKEVYDAALAATSKVIQRSLLDFL